jgi:hypothetical protein
MAGITPAHWIRRAHVAQAQPKPGLFGLAAAGRGGAERLAGSPGAPLRVRAAHVAAQRAASWNRAGLEARALCGHIMRGRRGPGLGPGPAGAESYSCSGASGASGASGVWLRSRVRAALRPAAERYARVFSYRASSSSSLYALARPSTEYAMELTMRWI